MALIRNVHNTIAETSDGQRTEHTQTIVLPTGISRLVPWVRVNESTSRTYYDVKSGRLEHTAEQRSYTEPNTDSIWHNLGRSFVNILPRTRMGPVMPPIRFR